MKKLSTKKREEIAAYAKAFGCRAFEVTLTARFVSQDDLDDVDDLARAVAAQFNPAARTALGFPVRTRKGKGKYARLPGHVEVVDLTALASK